MNQIFIVGMGPGNRIKETIEAQEVLNTCDVIVGYTLYVDLLREYYPQKEFVSTPMRQEIERCRMCYSLANEGKRVALVCSGDAGVYGMASPMYELLPEYENTELIVIPGITAANAGAAILGSVLNHDYCVISLSDLLTPWEIISKRIKAAIEGDFAIAIYNPSSHKRSDYLKRAIDVMYEAGAEKTRACGYVRNIGRQEEEARVLTLSELYDTQVDMFTTVFIGNSNSYIYENKLITKRGYSI